MNQSAEFSRGSSSLLILYFSFEHFVTVFPSRGLQSRLTLQLHRRCHRRLRVSIPELSRWLVIGRESTRPSPLPTPPPPPPPPLQLPSEVGELHNPLALMSAADFDYTFSLALGVEH